MFQTGGIATFNAGLGVGEDESTVAGETDDATGLYEISGGTLTTNITSGNALRVGSAGNGTFVVIGDDAVIDVNGGFIVGNTADGVGNLSYRFETGDSLSMIDVSGTATFSSGTGLSLDSSLAAPTQTSYDLLTALDVIDNGLTLSTPGWTHQIVPGGNGEILRVLQLATLFWDIDGATAGSGGTSPSGNWDGTTANFTSDAAGASAATTAVTSSTTDVVFAAGSDGTGSYTVTVSGTQAANSVQIARGDVTLTGGTLAVGTFDVAAGASSTVSSTVTGNASGSVTKTGPGTLTLTGANTYTGGTNVQAGVLEVTRMHENNAVNIIGGTLRILESSPGVSSGHPSGDDASVSRPSSLSIAPGATLDITNNDVIIDYTGASPIATYEALVASGYNVIGDWQGDGIVSSIAANDGNYVVAIADNAALAAPFGTAQGGPLFAGVDVDLDTVLIKFTHRADINLDGVVTPDDSAIFGGNYDESITSGHTWAFGDLNYDGMCTPDDAAIFGGAYDESLASLPEPGSLAAVGLLGLGLARRRRRS
jgi:autotransporter-associated beta strand protein